MSNRFLWILIIFWFIWAWYLYYNLSYLPQIKAEELRLIQEKEDNEKKVLVKKIDLVKKEIIKNNISNADKIEEIKENNKNYKTFKLNNNLKAYFKEISGKLDLYYNDNKIWNFNLINKDNLRVELILWSTNYIYIEIWNDKYLFNSITNIVKKIELNIEVLYVKKGLSNKLIFVTPKWSFNYNIFENKLEFFNYFNDYVYYNEWYIWIVRFNDNRMLNNLWFESNNENLIVYYNSSTKEKKIIFRTILDYKKLYIENNNIYIETEDWELYELENI